MGIERSLEGKVVIVTRAGRPQSSRRNPTAPTAAVRRKSSPPVGAIRESPVPLRPPPTGAHRAGP